MSNGFDDNEQFIRQFIIETEEHIESIENHLLELERNLNSKESFNEESINSLFRAIHTIKGLSGMLEFSNLLDFTHLWENLLDKIRKKKQEINSQIIDVSFEGLDLLIKILDKIKETRADHGVPIEAILVKLEKISNNEEQNNNSEVLTSKDDQLIQKLSPIFQKNLSEFEKNKLVQEINNKQNIYEIILYLNKDCFNKNISYLSTCINLEFLGEIINISCNKNSIPALEDFDPEIFDLEIYILFSSEKETENIYQIIKNNSDR